VTHTKTTHTHKKKKVNVYLEEEEEEENTHDEIGNEFLRRRYDHVFHTNLFHQ